MPAALVTDPTPLQIDVDGGRLAVERSGSGAPLVLVHGWAMDQRLFQPQREALAADFDVITFDRRGFGHSTAPPDLRRETQDIVSLLDSLGLDRVHLLGMSQGGRVALRFAAEHPERLVSLALQGPVIDGYAVDEPAAERIPVAEYAALVKAGDLDTFRRRWLNHPMMSLENAPEASRSLARTLLEDYEGRDLLAFEAAQYAYPDGVLARLATFPGPVLILTGALETAARKAHAERLLETFEDAREVVLPHSGHLSNLVEPDAYNAALKAFCLASQSVGG